MLYGGKKFVIPVDSDYGVICDDEPDEFDEDEAIVVQFWVSPYSDDEHHIEIEGGDMGGMPVWVAKKVAKAISILSRWPSTKAGIAEIARLREKHESRSTPSESVAHTFRGVFTCELCHRSKAGHDSLDQEKP